MIEAKVIADSVSPTGQRLVTLEATFHRFILSQVNTHRALSKSSGSSRAVPFRKQVEAVLSNPAVPVSFPEHKPGMQGGEQVSSVNHAESMWKVASRDAVYRATYLNDLGVHKSVTNRMLEPYLWHTAILSGTMAGWDNLLYQRLHHDTQPEFVVLAHQMRAAIDNSVPTELDYGQWHTPYVIPGEFEDQTTMLRVSAARSARVSYLNHHGVKSVEDDLSLFDKLAVRTDTHNPPHYAPLEHVATPHKPTLTERLFRFDKTPGNFDGWEQLRHREDAWQTATK